MGSREQDDDDPTPASGMTRERTPAPPDFLAVPASLLVEQVFSDLKAQSSAEEVRVQGILARGLASRYAIERLIARGGMALVYLATDLRHERRVAIKVLRASAGPALGADRFAREIAVAAQLQHPHLVALHDSGEVEGLRYYVMPHVAGESLRQRLTREHQLPVDEAVRLACEVADALDHAHRHHVIHRDIKPENILLNDGHAMVADFGIARAIGQMHADSITGAGVSIGTPQYMSPEQLSGDHAVDGRSDIYSLGCVLYEMLAGDPPHSASTPAAMAARVLHARVESVRTLRPTVPMEVDAALKRALALVPADRFDTASEFARALRDPSTPSPRSTVSATHSAATAPLVANDVAPMVTRYARAIAIVSVLLLAFGASAWWLRPATVSPELRFALIPAGVAPLASTDGPAVSIAVNASWIAFLAREGAWRGIVVREMRTGALTRVAGSADAEWVRLSAAGDSVLFRARDRVWLGKIGGAAPRSLGLWALDASWTHDERDIMVGRAGSIYRLLADSNYRYPSRVTPDSIGPYRSSRPHVLPGGGWALVSRHWRGTATEARVDSIWALRLSDGSVRALSQFGRNPQYVDVGFVLFDGDDGSVWARPFSRWLRRFSGKAMPVLSGVASRNMAVSRDGTLAYVRDHGRERRIVLVDRAGKRTILVAELRAYKNVRVSPDGQRLALGVDGGGVWVFDRASATLSPVAAGAAGLRPEWSPDGWEIAWMVAGSAGPGAFGRSVRSVRWDGAAPSRVLLTHSRNLYEVAFGASEGVIAVQADLDDSTHEDIFVRSVDSPDILRPIAMTRAAERAPRLTRDGRLLAYESDESGRFEVYAVELSGLRRRTQISSGGGRYPMWAANGRELFYRVPGHIMSAQLIVGTELIVSRRDTLLTDQFLQPDHVHPSYDVMPDGQHFVMIEPADTASVDSLIVVVNWAQATKERLRRRAP